MTHHAAQRAGEVGRRETLAKPPPAITERRETPLFQTMDELQVRRGNSTGARERLYLWGGGLLIGSVLFGTLYLMILFWE